MRIHTFPLLMELGEDDKADAMDGPFLVGEDSLERPRCLDAFGRMITPRIETFRP